MNTTPNGDAVITSLSLDRELIRDLTPDELNGAVGGVQLQPETSGLCVVVTLISVISLIASGCPNKQ
jgi:hypothetical protein